MRGGRAVVLAAGFASLGACFPDPYPVVERHGPNLDADEIRLHGLRCELLEVLPGDAGPTIEATYAGTAPFDCTPGVAEGLRCKRRGSGPPYGYDYDIGIGRRGGVFYMTRMSNEPVATWTFSCVSPVLRDGGADGG
jgi:hypothetical protein